MIHMNFKVKKSDIYGFICVFLIFLYSFTKAGIHDYIYPNSFICYLSFGVIIIFAIKLGGFPLKRQISVTELAILLCAFILIINRNQNFLNGEFEDGLSFVTIVIFFIEAKTNDKWHKFIVPVMGIWIAIHTIFTLLEYSISGFYMNIIYPLMPSYASMHLRSVFNLGYMPGLAVHYSTNGMYLGVSLIVIASLVIFKNAKKINLIIAFIVAIALFLTGKRALIIFPLIAILILFYLYNSNKPLSRIGKIIILLICGVIAFIIASIFIPSVSNFIYRFIETNAAGDITLGRFEQAFLAIQQFLNNFLFGNGWDSFKYFHRRQFGVLVNVHNIYLQLLCENGIIGALPFFVFFSVSLFRTIKVFLMLRKKMTNKYPKAEFYLGLSIGMQCFFLLYGLTGNPLYDQQVFFPYIVCIAAGEYYVNSITKNYSYEHRYVNGGS